jgi:hypothetical protein
MISVFGSLGGMGAEPSGAPSLVEVEKQPQTAKTIEAADKVVVNFRMVRLHVTTWIQRAFPSRYIVSSATSLMQVPSAIESGTNKRRGFAGPGPSGDLPGSVAILLKHSSSPRNISEWDILGHFGTFDLMIIYTSQHLEKEYQKVPECTIFWVNFLSFV